MDDTAFAGIDGAEYSDRYPSVPSRWRGRCAVKQTKYIERSGTYVIEFVVKETNDADRAPVESVRSRVYTGLRGDPKITGVKMAKIREFLMAAMQISEPPKGKTWQQIAKFTGSNPTFLAGKELIVETMDERIAEGSGKPYIPTSFFKVA